MGGMMTGLLAVLGCGIAIGAQVTLNGGLGRVIGPVKAGLVVNFASGILAAVVMMVIGMSRGAGSWRIPASSAGIAAVSGALGIVIVTGIVVGIPRTGVAAGLAALFFGQMLVGVIVDAIGVSGMTAIPVDLRRIAGLVVLAGAVSLLIPRS